MSIRLRAVLLAAVICVSMAVATALVLWTDYLRTREQAEQTVADITRVVEKHIRDTVQQADTVISEVGRSIVRDGGTRILQSPERRAQLSGACKSLIGCEMLLVADPQGRTLVISTLAGRADIDISDRSYFRESVRTGKLYIDAAIVTRVPGNPIIFPIAKPVYDEMGTLVAVVSAGMRTDHLTSLYKLMGFALDPTITVFKGNGDVVARNPDMKLHVGKNNLNGPLFKLHLPRAPYGIYESESVLDGKTRVAAYRSVADLDLVIFSGIEKAVAFGAWRERAIVTLCSVSLLALLLLSMIAYSYRSLANQLALQAHNDVLDQLSHVDALTGVANRRLFDDTLRRDWARHERSRSPLSLLMIDIDYFKQFNDLYGHQAGDDCLKKVAKALQSCLQRKVDLVARYGGEEFAVILDGDAEGALTVATRMRNAVESLTIANQGSRVSPYVTISVGFASTAIFSASTPGELLRAADKALYAAKAQGKNRTAEAPSPEETRLKLVSPPGA